MMSPDIARSLDHNFRVDGAVWNSRVPGLEVEVNIDQKDKYGRAMIELGMGTDQPATLAYLYGIAQCLSPDQRVITQPAANLRLPRLNPSGGSKVQIVFLAYSDRIKHTARYRNRKHTVRTDYRPTDSGLICEQITKSSWQPSDLSYETSGLLSMTDVDSNDHLKVKVRHETRELLDPSKAEEWRRHPHPDDVHKCRLVRDQRYKLGVISQGHGCIVTTSFAQELESPDDRPPTPAQAHTLLTQSFVPSILKTEVEYKGDPDHDVARYQQCEPIVPTLMHLAGQVYSWQQQLSNYLQYHDHTL